MDSIEQLLSWSTKNGIVLNGITPKALPDRGIGIVATRRIEPNTTVLTVPTKALRTLSNTPKHIVEALKGASVHAILAASLCLDMAAEPAPSRIPDFGVWKAVLPSREDMTTSLPICWPEPLRALLPARAKDLLAQQRAKLDRDVDAVTSAWPELSVADYEYAWLLVNTRTFYHTDNATRAARLPREDHMVLQPVADLLNHSALPGSCAVAYDAAGFTFTTADGVAHEAGDEISIRYGSHSNDFLLVEYGFALAANPFDETCLDPFLCPLFDAPQRRALRDAGFWARYMLDADTACYRTYTALRMLCLPDHRWRAVLDGDRDEDLDRPLVDRALLDVLQRYETHVHRVLRELDDLDVKNKASKSSLRDRWIQIKQLLVLAISRLTA